MAFELRASAGTVAGRQGGVLQITHAMGEHSERYCELIDALLQASFTVYANDHRGHGRTAHSPEHFGDFGEGGFDLLVEARGTKCQTR